MIKEIYLWQILKCITFTRLRNLFCIAFAFVHSVITKKPHISGVPPILNVEPTNHCNLRCPLCDSGNGKMTRQRGQFNLSQFEKLLNEIGDQIWYLIIYHQGEPYIARDFLHVVQLAHARAIYTTTSTNAHFLDAATAEQTVRSGLTSIIISIDGTTQESYAAYRVGGSLEKALAGVRNLTSAKKRLQSATPKIILQFLLMRHNSHERNKFKTLAKHIGADRVLFKRIQVTTQAEAKQWLPADDQLSRYQLSDFRPKSTGTKICPRPWFNTLVNWDGRVVSCCFDKNASHVFGSLQNQPLHSIWNGAHYLQFRKNMLTQRDQLELCKDCHQGFGIWF